ncbi:MAG TPA: betaine--homocysteine S-methyltransferase [Spirillospora sp.]|nr:betaine--homocysteine S-methyltransferase [Spirillospora sp.]
MRISFQDLIAGGEPIVADGGMGTMLFSAGLKRGEAPELWNSERPDVVRRIQKAYLEAGAQIILTNSFGGNRVRLGMHGLAGRVTELNREAARLARIEADAAPQPVVVGGSVGPAGTMLEPLGELAFDEAVAIFEEQARALAEGGVDVFWIETMSDLEEVRAAVTGCRRASAAVPIVTTMTFDTKGRTMMGVTPVQAVQTLRELGAAALGANCGNGPAEIEGVIEAMRQIDESAILVAKSNAGLPRMVGDAAVYDATPDDMAAYARRVRARGARIIGACCGSTPEHIRAIAAALKDQPA